MIRLLIPDMPTADDLLPLLREIDAVQWYSNGGPLVRRLETALSQRVVHAPCTAVSNGTVALELALRALNLPPGAAVVTPAVTFVATGRAIMSAGLRPVLCDVAPDTWQLQPERVMAIAQADPFVRAVVPVAAFGMAVPVDPWVPLAACMPVVIDAAGAIFDQEPSPVPRISIAYSLHATKALPAGEGGAVACSDAQFVGRVAAMACFGPGGTNAKMSEYHASVALAALQRPRHPWRQQLDEWYAQLLPAGMRLQAGQQSARTLLPVLLPEGASAEEAAEVMAADGVETRRWYAPFLDERPDVACPVVGPMPITRALRRRLLGLPYHRFLTQADVVQVCASLAAAITETTADA